MDEVWERAVETALDGQTDCSSVRSLTLDGAVKCIHGRLPPPGLLEKYQSLEQLSIANVGVSSLEKFPRLKNLQKLILSDNRIAGGLEFLVEAGLDSLRDLDLSNNRIQFLEDLAPLAELKLVSLDLYECSVTRVKDYRARVFGMIKTLKYLDKMDADENERPETDEEDEEEEEDEEDPGSGEIDGEERSDKVNGGIMDADEDDDEGEESDEDEEETVRFQGVDRGVNGGDGVRLVSNGLRASSDGDKDDCSDEDEEDVEDEDDDDVGKGENGTVEWSDDEDIDEEEGDEEDVVEVHEVDESEEEDGVEEDEDEEDDDDDVDGEDDEAEGPGSAGRLTSTEGEIDGHEQGEEDENGEIGEEDEQGIEEDGEYEEDDGVDEEEDFGSEYLVQPIGQAEGGDVGGSDLEAGNDEDGEDEEDVDDEEDLCIQQRQQHPSHQQPKRKREEDDDDSVEDGRSSKHH